ncbi:hypothetical protein SAMN05660462_02910 [Proteiniborus ethanoligenes]|uniref:Uncharacterized protein n=1 Tax=Proteiniborus ethanoligenes TaxID=415015 RepID=A0A1H3SH42_9FIRM|nr:hypothetical protein [Proteiniborus ethanoligenes]SDZ37383.1 hypothetical protein SAMN05660462_02910 [Proteiniborus ethanoligenes]
MGKQCKYAKVGKPLLYGVADLCYCTSPGNQNSSKGNQVKRKDGSGFPITGYADGTGWWLLCIEGRNYKGVTPSRCIFYR